MCKLSIHDSPQGQTRQIQNGPQVQNLSPCMDTMANSASKDEEKTNADVMTNQNCDDILKVARKAVVGKHPNSVVIKKEKMWTCFPVMNSNTGRLNKTFQCNLCQKRFDKFSNVLDHIKTHTNERPY